MLTTKSFIIGVSVVLFAVALWSIVGFLPQCLFADPVRAGVFGDSFGFVNSLFAGFGFAFVAAALLLQMKELHDAMKTQAEQGQMQLKQMQIAERTVRIQESMRLDSVRVLAIDAFLKISKDMLHFKHTFLAWHPDNNRPTHSDLVDRATERTLKNEYFNAYTALRSNCLGVGLLFDRRGDALGRAIQDLFATATQ